MSVRNGDKARFGRLRKHRILLRKRAREIQGAMASKAAAPATATPESDGSSSRSLKPMG